MTTSLFRRFAIPALVIVAVLAVAGWMMKPKSPTKPAAVPPTATAAPAELEFLPQEIVTVSPVELRQVLLLSGSLRALDLATVKARVAGEVREILVREGEAVRAGQVVARMDATEYEAKLAQARGNLNSAKAQQEIAAKARDNNAALVDKGFISKNAFDNSASQFAAAKASVDATQGAVDVAQKQLNDTVLRAPIAGLVSTRNVQPGEKVSPDYKLLEIVNLQKMELEAAVPATEIGRIAIGQSVSLHIEGMPQSFDGKVVRINPAAQAGSRSIPVYVQVANPGNQLRTGMFAEGKLVLNSKPGVLALPQSAVRRDGNGAYVLAIANGKIARTPVTTGSEGISGDEPRIEIVSGLDFGAQVVRTDMGNLASGTPVRVAAKPATTNAETSATPAAATTGATAATPAAK
jgi:RND family efflux transporter MFP subunit